MIYRYQDSTITKSEQTNFHRFGNKYYVNSIYPDIPVSDDDQYIITTFGDRLDLLAYDIYKDQTLWWIISSANNLPGDSLIPPIGIQLRIPTDIKSIVNSYKAINRVR